MVVVVVVAIVVENCFYLDHSPNTTTSVANIVRSTGSVKSMFSLLHGVQLQYWAPLGRMKARTVWKLWLIPEGDRTTFFN
jgi:hypothetical protein